MKLINVSSWMISMKSCLTSWCWCWSPRLSWSMRETIHLRSARHQIRPASAGTNTFTSFQLYTSSVIFLCVFSACEWQQRWRRKETPWMRRNTPTARTKLRNSAPPMCQYRAIQHDNTTLMCCWGGRTCFQIGLPQWCWSKINNGKFEFNPLFPKINLNH